MARSTARAVIAGPAVAALAVAGLLTGCACGTAGAGTADAARLTFTPAALLEAAVHATTPSPDRAGTPPTGSPTGSRTGTATSDAAPTGAATGPAAGAARRGAATGRIARPATAGPLTVRAQARDQATVVATLPPTTPLGSARVLQVLQVAGGWVRVALPVRPNGTTGWVRSSDVVLADVTQRLVVDLSARTLNWWSGGVQVLSTQVAVGAAGTPTPKGSFFVVDRVRPPDPTGTYGPFALGLSAHSSVLTEFGDGDAQIGIHGTDEPGSIGTATTHGCVRVPDEVAAALADVPLGTPVDVVA